MFDRLLVFFHHRMVCFQEGATQAGFPVLQALVSQGEAYIYEVLH